MVEPPKFTRMTKLLVLKKLCFVMQIAIDVEYAARRWQARRVAWRKLHIKVVDMILTGLSPFSQWFFSFSGKSKFQFLQKISTDRLFSPFSTNTSLCLRWINFPQLSFSCEHSTISKETIEGVWTGYSILLGVGVYLRQGIRTLRRESFWYLPITEH